MNIRQSFKARYIGIPIKGILLWRTIAPGKYYEIETVKHTDGISVRIETAETWIKYTDADFNKNWRIENDD